MQSFEQDSKQDSARDSTHIRKIIHVDMDAFFASVEQRDHPELQGKPVAVGGSSRRGVVAAASYEARQFGVKSAMPSVTAKRLCPDLIFVKGSFANYKSISQQINRIFADYTDLIEPLSLDEAYLDVTARCAEHQQTATEIAQIIKQRIQDELHLVASAGVSYNKFLAKVASDYDKPDGLYVIRPEQGAVFVEQLPIRAFRGVGPATEQKLKALGITTGLELKQHDIVMLQARFGKYGRYLYYAARAIDERPVRAQRERKSIGRERTFGEDITDMADIYAELQKIAEDVEARLQQKGQQAMTITLKVKYADFEQITRAHTLLQPIQTAADIMQPVPELIEKTEIPHRPVRLLGLTASHLVPEGTVSYPEAKVTQQIALF